MGTFIRYILLALIACGGCHYQKEHGSWSGQFSGVTLEDLNGREHKVLGLAIEDGTKVGDPYAALVRAKGTAVLLTPQGQAIRVDSVARPWQIEVGGTMYFARPASRDGKGRLRRKHDVSPMNLFGNNDIWSIKLDAKSAKIVEASRYRDYNP